MIKGVLYELNLEEEVTEAYSIFEEEGSSSTPKKENVEDERVTVEGQIIKFHMNK